MVAGEVTRVQAKMNEREREREKDAKQNNNDASNLLPHSFSFITCLDNLITFSNPSSNSGLLLMLSLPSERLVVKLLAREAREGESTAATEVEEEGEEGC